MKTVLTIAGSDPSGGAGIQADIKTFCAYKVYGMSVITSLTVQNTVGVQETFHVPADLVAKQLKAIKEDIRIDAIKIGMVGNRENLEVIIRFIEETPVPFIVLDPVLYSSSGTPLLEKDAIEVLKERLIGRCTLLTPNLREASILSGVPVIDINSMREAASQLIARTKVKSVLVKGGHLDAKATDLLYDGVKFEIFEIPKVARNAHGTGCTLAAGIAAGLVRGFDMKTAVSKAKGYVLAGIKSGFDDLGKGNMPLNHFVPI